MANLLVLDSNVSSSSFVENSSSTNEVSLVTGIGKYLGYFH
jgi:hypothetical protein